MHTKNFIFLLYSLPFYVHVAQPYFMSFKYVFTILLLMFYVKVASLGQ
jgi:hypothetical protein